MAVFDFLTTVMTSLDNKIPVCALYMDLSKAFDYVDHQILLNKLYKYGIRGTSLDLIASYLTNRKQSTLVTRVCTKTSTEINYTSEYREIKQGVPQGSVLGPLLFIIYINDLPKVTNHPTILFADDSTVVFTSEDKLSLEQDINSTLSDIIKWLNNNQLKMNFDKTKIMIFRNRKAQFTDINIDHRGNKINEIATTKFLGMSIDYNLNWKTHVDTLNQKLNKQSYALHMLAKTVDTSAVLAAYHGYVGSLIKYGIIFWGNSTNKDTAFKAQKRCIRGMFNINQTDSCRPYFAKYNLLTLPCVYIYEIASFARANKQLFDRYRSKRHGDKICCKSSKTALYTKSIFSMAPRIYNHLPKSILETPSIGEFKKKLKRFLLFKCYYSIQDYLMEDVRTYCTQK